MNWHYWINQPYRPPSCFLACKSFRKFGFSQKCKIISGTAPYKKKCKTPNHMNTLYTKRVNYECFPVIQGRQIFRGDDVSTCVILIVLQFPTGHNASGAWGWPFPSI